MNASMQEHRNDQFSGERQLFLLIGGFLGAGKTTLIGLLAEWLRSKGQRIGLVTNDQGEGLLDTASGKQAAGAESRVREITGGCFCCRLDDLVTAIKELDEVERPNAIIAEPVGSCTDLMATVIRPLESVYNMPMRLAPLSVVLDARRALAAMGGKQNKRSFHRDIGYVYRKQLEEAEWLVVNKTDLLEEVDLQDLRSRLVNEFPEKRIFFLSAKTKKGLEHWFGALMSSQSTPGATIDIDYERYAVGEALLGWVNQTAECHAEDVNLDWGPWLLNLGNRISTLLDERHCEVGHFKMSLEEKGRRHRVHQVLGDDALQIHVENAPSNPTPQLLVNLRAEGDAKLLERQVMQAISEQTEVEVVFSDQAAFQPGKPEPTHRVVSDPLTR